MIEVALELPPSDWDALRRQTRDWWDVAAADNKACLLRPFASPSTGSTATVTVDGVRRERVAVRKKGFLGSLNDERPALKLRFDALVLNQSLHGLKRLTLNNSVQDPTWLRQCLAYRVFEAAGVPVPWCNFAHVTANGRDLGLYVNVESMDRHWVRRHFERDDGELWEGEWSDFDRTVARHLRKKGRRRGRRPGGGGPLVAGAGGQRHRGDLVPGHARAARAGDRARRVPALLGE